MGIEIGQIIDGKYRVTARIGEGGMGAVFAGEHLKLHRRVAIKTLHPMMAQDPQVITRFEREAQAAGRIGNDHILEVIDIGELPQGDRFMVMEFLDGEAMNTRLARLGRMTPQQVYPLVRQMLHGLAAAHAAGIVHRDLKPANVFILREKAGIPDYIKIIDFGISKFKSLGGDASQTRTGTIIGTPAYMSPEQARGLREADARSDIYAVGVILYEAVTGRVPFEGASTNDLLFKIFLSEIPPIASVAPDVDPAFGSLAMRALAKDPNDRFGSAEEFVAALDTWAQTGRGVAVPSPLEGGATMLEAPPAVLRQSGVGQPAAPMPATVQTWEEQRASRASVAAPASSSKAVLFAVSGLILAALVGGVALYSLKVSVGAPPTAQAGAAAQTVVSTTANASPPAPPPLSPPPPPAVATPAVATQETAPEPPASNAVDRGDSPRLVDAGQARATLSAPHAAEAPRTAPPADDPAHRKAAQHRPATTPRATASPLDQL